MKIAKYYNNKDVRLEDIEKPELGPGEFLLKVMACGICGSDVMEWYRIKKAPLVLGHEATGVIDQIAEEVKDFKKGDRVFVSHHVPCNECHYCLNGHHTACQMLHTTNFYPGGFSEYVRVPRINVSRGTFLLPESVNFDQGTFIEPLACVVRGQREANFKSGQSVLILGAGISGILHLLLAKASGAAKVFLTDISQSRLNLAQKFGADLSINAASDIKESLLKANDNRLADLVIVCTSALSAFNQALELVDRGGTILCFAPTEPGVKLEVPINDFWRNGIKIAHSYGSSPIDTSQAIELISQGALNLDKMITHRLNLEDTALGFNLVSQGKDSLKVIIQPHKSN